MFMDEVVLAGVATVGLCVVFLVGFATFIYNDSKKKAADTPEMKAGELTFLAGCAISKQLRFLHYPQPAFLTPTLFSLPVLAKAWKLQAFFMCSAPTLFGGAQ